MKNEVGLWINYKHAVIVIVLDDGQEEIKEIAFNIDKNSSNALQMDDVSKEDRKKALIIERKRYYDDVISYLRNTNAVLIMGPGKAKVELQKRLIIHGFDDQTVVVKAAKKMTEKQIIEDVHRYFRKTQYGL